VAGLRDWAGYGVCDVAAVFRGGTNMVDEGLHTGICEEEGARL
jgi:hypothetical protein